NLPPNIHKVLTGLQQKTDIPVVFPSRLPTPPAHTAYYVSTEVTKRGYTIYVDSSKDCHGVHSCNIGMIKAETGANPVIYYDMQNQELTKSVILNQNRKGYFTPGHPMGDYWPTRLVWRDKNILYTIIWQLKPQSEQVDIIAMADSFYKTR
ncbi:MAG: hypothetical protein KAT71_06930, partial [Gammaproteobacteria bacterium]|nr:hypothetical protein [Gammaproteobacteria bacterium]